MIEKVGRDTRPAMLLEIRRRADDGISLWTPKRNRNHVAGHEVRHPHAEIEPFCDDVDQPALGDEIDMHLAVAATSRRDASFACSRTGLRLSLCLYYPGRRNPSAALKAFIGLARELSAKSGSRRRSISDT